MAGSNWTDDEGGMMIDVRRDIASILIELIKELRQAEHTYPTVHSLHHAMGVLFEEVDELWEEVRKKPSARDRDMLRREAIQVASCAIRLIKEQL